MPVQVSYETLPNGHPIRKFCEDNRITDPVVRHELCLLVMNAVKTAAVRLLGDLSTLEEEG